MAFERRAHQSFMAGVERLEELLLPAYLGQKRGTVCRMSCVVLFLFFSTEKPGRSKSAAPSLDSWQARIQQWVKERHRVSSASSTLAD